MFSFMNPLLFYTETFLSSPNGQVSKNGSLLNTHYGNAKHGYCECVSPLSKLSDANGRILLLARIVWPLQYRKLTAFVPQEFLTQFE